MVAYASHGKPLAALAAAIAAASLAGLAHAQSGGYAHAAAQGSGVAQSSAQSDPVGQVDAMTSVGEEDANLPAAGVGGSFSSLFGADTPLPGPTEVPGPQPGSNGGQASSNQPKVNEANSVRADQGLNGGVSDAH